MEIFVTTVAGATMTLDVENADLIESIKDQINVKIGVPVDSQVLVYNGTVLENGRTLQDYNIQRGATLNLFVQATVTNVRADKVEPTALHLSWTLATGDIPPGYVVFQSTTGQAPWTVLPPVTGTAIDVSGLTPATTYWFAVSARYSGDITVLSAPPPAISVTTAAVETPTTPPPATSTMPPPITSTLPPAASTTTPAAIPVPIVPKTVGQSRHVTAGESLPLTGASAAPPLLTGTLLLAIGMALVAAARRRWTKVSRHHLG
ncbi:hypothetical protein GCM10009839_65120 [Catenulispora yoronensis]|uniref:Fibronectin type-III domain-containing protein n=1 Tax=Catenulispora yoronensis TaxID=450799 RepID=A0ABN2V2R1_9ACTN